MNQIKLSWLLQMGFSKRLSAIRKNRKMTQQSMADAIGIHVSQIKRYESGETQPSLEVLRKIALALNISADVLLFDDDERELPDDLNLKFEAINDLPKNEQMVVREVLDSLIIKYQSRRWDSARQAAK